MNTIAHFACRGNPWKAARQTFFAAALLSLPLCAGCPPAGAPKTLIQRLQDEDPTVRADAAVQAARAHDEKALPYLVDRLGDIEPDVRMMASVALRELAGAKTFDEMGWRFYDAGEGRAKAQERWRQWLRGRGQGPASAPATQSASTMPASAPATSSAPAPATAPAPSPLSRPAPTTGGGKSP